MKLTREEALKLHRQMWSDMKAELVDRKDDKQSRDVFKELWIKRHFPGMEVKHDCFLCEFALQMVNETSGRPHTFHDGYEYCKYCPIDWSDNIYKGNVYACEKGEVIWCKSPISKILALPERRTDE